MTRHRWSRPKSLWLGRTPKRQTARITYCLRGIDGQHPWCLCRKYTTRSGRVVGYLPRDRDIRQGLLPRAPRCKA